MPEPKNKMSTEFTPRFLERIDKRTATGRVIWGRWDELAADLGGEEHLSYQRKMLARRALFLEALIEQSELAAAEGERLEPTHYSQMVNSMLGLLRALGLERQARDVSLDDVLREASE